MCSLCEDKTHMRSQCPYGYLDLVKTKTDDPDLLDKLRLLAIGDINPTLVCIAYPIVKCCEVPSTPDVVSDIPKSLLKKFPPSEKVKKSVRFSDCDNVSSFDAPLSENYNPRVKEPYHPKDVSEFRASTGDWWDEDEDETNNLYNINKEINCCNPLVNDFEQYRKTTFTSKKVIQESKLQNYHQYPNPMKFLLGEFLVTQATPFLKKYSPKIAKHLKVMIENILSQFENEVIEVYPFYKNGTRLLRTNMGLLQARIKIIDKYLVQAE